MLASEKSIIIHDDAIIKVIDRRKNEMNENIDTYLLKLYQNIILVL